MPKRTYTPEQIERRDQRNFAARIRTTFTNAGFTYLATRDIERKFGNKVGELDAVFLYENIILVCEDTISASPSNIKSHMRNKATLFSEIQSDKAATIAWLKATFPERFEPYDSYTTARYKIFFLYFSKTDVELSDSDQELNRPLVAVDSQSLSYFHKISQNIRYSSRSEVFRYLGLRADQIGSSNSGSDQKQIKTSIIYPADSTGLQNGVRLVSFMMSADMLLRNSYVLRKDNWQDSVVLYQRLIEKDRIQSIRKYLARTKAAFLNNIIVSLPKGVHFQDEDGNQISLDEVDSFQGHTMTIPNQLNSICIIDGQHRVFAHYEGNDALEEEIANLRQKVHLLVTGLVFPSGMTESKRRTFESEVFLDINSTARRVPADVILYIETVKDPYSGVGIAREVLRKLNKDGVFQSKLQLSLMVDAPIKTASIIRFAMKPLVEITSDPDRESLFNFWRELQDGNQGLAAQNNDTLLSEYVDWLVKFLNLYFSAVRAVFKDEWSDPESRILSTTSINGFLIALRRSWKVHGLKDFASYRSRFEKMSTDFSRQNFEFASSQYGKFSRTILAEAFDIGEDGQSGNGL